MQHDHDLNIDDYMQANYIAIKDVELAQNIAETATMAYRKLLYDDYRLNSKFKHGVLANHHPTSLFIATNQNLSSAL